MPVPKEGMWAEGNYLMVDLVCVDIHALVDGVNPDWNFLVMSVRYSLRLGHFPPVSDNEVESMRCAVSSSAASVDTAVRIGGDSRYPIIVLSR